MRLNVFAAEWFALNTYLTMNKEELCPVCKTSAKQKCGGCRKIYYCTKEHQRSHWPIHATNCQAFKLEENSVLGRHYVATRDINPGDLILHEKKALLEIPDLSSSPICLNCYVGLAVDNAKPCKKCGWPLCLSCASHGSECELTIEYLKSKAKIDLTNCELQDQGYNIVIVLRALALRNTNPKAYRTFLGHEDHLKNANKLQFSPMFRRIRYAAGFVERFMKPGVVKRDEITKIISIVLVNAIEAGTPKTHAALYSKASYFEHNCLPNCSVSKPTAGGILIKAAKPIAKGDHLSIAYSDATDGVFGRRDYLSETKFFDCTCERCSDPTELGTMFNAIKCTKNDCTGYMLPETFLLPNNEYRDFICRNCNDSKSGLEVISILKSISVKLNVLDERNEQECRRFIKDHTKLLHENHHFMVEAKKHLVYAIGVPTPGAPPLSIELWTETITLCRQLEVLFKTLLPGEIQFRGFVSFLKAEVLLHSLRNGTHLPAGPDSFFQVIKEAKMALIEAYDLLRDEPIRSMEGRLAIKLRLLLNKENTSG